MKKLVIVFLLIPVLGWSQVKSGITYSEHPAYDVITKSQKVWESGTEAELRALYAEDAKIWGPGDKEASTVDEEVSNMLWWQENYKDIKFTVMAGANPDIIKYENDEKGVWTMDWMVFSAVHKKSGLAIQENMHTNSYVTNEGKITMSVSYFDVESAGAQVQASMGMHRNGRVFDEHPLINKVNEIVAHYEAGETAEMASYFAKDAKFNRSSTMGEKALNLEERIATWKTSISTFSVRDLEQFGYPDAIYYKRSDSWSVYSWWWVNNTNADTGETSRKFLHMVHNFNKEGKIASEGIFFND